MTWDAPAWIALLPIALLPLAGRRRGLGIALPTIGTPETRDQGPEAAGTALARSTALALLVLALAGPGIRWPPGTATPAAADLMLVLDLSGSMAAEDLKPNRLSAARRILDGFIRRRASDRLGLVVFRARTMTACPLTRDSVAVAGALATVQPEDLPEDGTAIGDAVAVATGRLAEGPSPGKAIILLTDGVNNSGRLGPREAADLAKRRGITIHTIAVGRAGGAPVPVMDPRGRRGLARWPDGRIFLTQVDRGALADMAQRTGGTSFDVEDTAALERAYGRIEAMVRTQAPPAPDPRPPQPLAGWAALLAAVILLVDRYRTVGPGALLEIGRLPPDAEDRT